MKQTCKTCRYLKPILKNSKHLCRYLSKLAGYAVWVTPINTCDEWTGRKEVTADD